FSVIYYLNTTLSPAGYNLTTIDTFTAHADNRASQKYTVSVSYVGGGGNFVSLGTFASATPGGSQQAHHMQLADASGVSSAPFATNVAAIRFDISFVNNPDVWREIDVQGAPSAPLVTIVITTQPQPVTRYVGEAAQLSVVAGGEPPLFYQWRKTGADLANATNPVLSFASVRTADAGQYTVVVTNANHSVTSAPAALVARPVDNVRTALAGYWGFNETSGLVAVDASGQGNHGQLNNYLNDDSQWVPGAVGGALSFRGPDSIEWVYVADYPKASNTFTLSAWVWADKSPAWASIAKNWGSPARGQFHLGLNGTDGDLSDYIGTGSDVQIGVRAGADKALPIGSWQHVAAVCDGTMARIYQNGVELGAVPYDGTLINPPPMSSLAIGSKTDDSGLAPDFEMPGFWQGRIDDLGLWTRGLTPDEILAVYAAGRNGRPLTEAVVGAVAPVIVTTPQGQTQPDGGTALFTVIATGTSPLQYQWRKDGVQLPGATNMTLTIAPVHASGTGAYDVVVCNVAGCVTSAPPAVLMLPTLFVVVDEKGSGNQQKYASQVSATDVINNGQNTLSSVSVSGYTPFTEGGSSAADPGSPDFVLNDGAHGDNTGGAQSMSGNAAFDLDGTFSVTYHLNTTLNPLGYNLTTIDTFTAHADNRASQKYTVSVSYVGGGGNFVSLGTFASATPGGGQQAHHMQLASAPGVSPPPFAINVAAIRFDISFVNNPDLWREIDVQGAPSGVLVITTQPQPVTRYAGEAAQLSVVAVGDPPLFYQWRKDGADVPGGTNPLLSLASVSAADAGQYTVVVTDVKRSITSAPAALAVRPVENVRTALAGYWAFDERSGVTAVDSSGHGNDGQLNNFLGDDSQWVAGAVGGALTFRGPDSMEWVSVADYPKPTNGMTIALWVWANSRPTWASFVNNWGNPSPGQFHFGLTANDGDMSNYLTQQNGAQAGPVREGVPVPLGSWQHVALVCNGAQMRLYRNGVEVGSVPYDGTIQPTPLMTSLAIGSKTDDSGMTPDFVAPGFWDGKMDDLGLWTRGLNPDEVLAIYAAGRNGRPLTEAVVGPVAPVIVTGPQDQLQPAGGAAEFTVVASGTSPLQYQWRRDGAELPDATNATLTIAPVHASDAGAYDVVVCNVAGCATNAPPAMLRLKTLVPVLDEKSSGNQQAYASAVSATDLINNGQSTLSGVSVTGYTPFAEGDFAAADPGPPDFILNDGAHGGNTGNAQSMSGNAAFDLDGTFSVIYYLNTTLSPAGYNLTSIDTFTAHADNRASQKYTVLVSYVGGGGNFVSLGTFESATPGGGQQAHHMQLADASGVGSAPFATNVAAIRFDISFVNNPDVWREIDVHGYAAVKLMIVLQSDGQVMLLWQAGTLESADELKGAQTEWTPVPGAAAPSFALSPNAAKKFYRVRL
ncbi:MAG: immunoglobulin domain-containing protein, partial [Chloroflexi bacterium]|nr:immunoglobulin domain-containing protein [Chloroflexota bacterium]